MKKEYADHIYRIYESMGCRLRKASEEYYINELLHINCVQLLIDVTDYIETVGPEIYVVFIGYDYEIDFSEFVKINKTVAIQDMIQAKFKGGEELKVWVVNANTYFSGTIHNLKFKPYLIEELFDE